MDRFRRGLVPAKNATAPTAGPEPVHTAHGRQIVAAAQVHRVYGLFQQVGRGKVVAAAVDVRRGEDAVGRGGFKAAAVGAFAGDDDFFQLSVFGFGGQVGGMGGRRKNGGNQQGQRARGRHFSILPDKFILVYRFTLKLLFL